MPGIKGPHWKDTLIDFGLQFLCIYSLFYVIEIIFEGKENP